MHSISILKALATTYLVVIIAGACTMIAIQPGDRGASDATTQTPAEALYTEYCQGCHGASGAGDGKLAYLLYPKPRDFTSGLFKIRSTASGELPTNDDLAQTIANGMPGTAMPAFRFLANEQIQLLVTHVRQLGLFQDQAPIPLTIPQPPDQSEDMIALGEQLYVDLGCNQCHGVGGKGDGPSANLLKDDWGYPIQVRDFTRGTYIGGSGVEDIYLRFATGMSGTPMPSYLDIFQEIGESDQERQEMVWGLVYYVKSLETDEVRGDRTLPPEDGSIISMKIADSVTQADLINPRSAAWEMATAVDVPVSRLWQTNADNIEFVSVRSVYNNRQLAVMLEWDDGSKDDAVYRIQDFQDAAAIQFSLSGEMGFHGMGSAANPVNIWHWKAEWQLRSAGGGTPDIDIAYPNRVSDGDVETYPAEIAEQAYLPGRDAGNPLYRSVIISPVEELNATGPETVTSQAPNTQNVLGSGEWNGDKWRVVFVRDLITNTGDDLQFRAGEGHPIAFAVWDGSEADRNGQKMISTWYTLVLQQ